MTYCSIRNYDKAVTNVVLVRWVRAQPDEITDTTSWKSKGKINNSTMREAIEILSDAVDPPS